MRRLLRVCAVAMLALGAPLAASAQTALADDDRPGLVAVGAMIGAELDTPDDWLLFGADGRVRMQRGFEISPRFTYRPLDDGRLTQFDVNLLRNVDLARPGRLRPYFGVGGALRTFSPERGDGDTSVGLNLITGTRFAMRSGAGYEPFFTAQYTIVQDQLNAFSLVVGASFRLRN